VHVARRALAGGTAATAALAQEGTGPEQPPLRLPATGAGVIAATLAPLADAAAQRADLEVRRFKFKPMSKARGFTACS
jgi:hypothetical protein